MEAELPLACCLLPTDLHLHHLRHRLQEEFHFHHLHLLWVVDRHRHPRRHSCRVREVLPRHHLQVWAV